MGVKIYEEQENYEQLFLDWSDMGINTAFISVALAYDEAFRKLALEHDVTIFIILPIFLIRMHFRNIRSGMPLHNTGIRQKRNG